MINTTGGAHAKILYGIALQQLGHPLSAERQFAAAARLAPNDPDARAAAAVGLFDKDNPSRAFGRLGPYPARLGNAIEQLQAGDTAYIARPTVDSYHQVWFELHEDLLVTLGRERAA